MQLAIREYKTIKKDNSKKILGGKIKKSIVIVLLLIMQVIILAQTKEFNIPPSKEIEYPKPVKKRDDIKLQSTHKFEKIYEYEFEKEIYTVYFSPASLHDSGDFAFAELMGKGPADVYGFDKGIKYLGKFNPQLYSYHGKCFFAYVKQKDSSKNIVRFGRIYDNTGKILWDCKVQPEKPFHPAKINDKGDLIYRESPNVYYLIKHDKTKIKIGPFYKKETLKTLYLANYIQNATISNNGNFVIQATENKYLKPSDWHSFPLGSRLFFYNKTES